MCVGQGPGKAEIMVLMANENSSWQLLRLAECIKDAVELDVLHKHSDYDEVYVAAASTAGGLYCCVR